jgi:hypothetical protein
VSFKRIMIDGKYSDPVYHRGLYVTEAETKVTLGTKAVISGKVDSSGNGGGVYVADGARLEMTTDGTISNSTAYGGGRVFVDSSGGTFTMWGGNISHNTVSGIGSRGGGVYVRGGVGGSFTMWDGTISDNEAFTNGGGLSVYGNGTSFTMWGDEISGNIASTNGGGVGLDGGTGTSIFTMWGSVVYGNEAGNGDKKNTATNGTAFYKWRTTAQWNENKLGTLVDLTSTNDTLDLR